MFDVTVLWKAPEINPITKKARSIPVLNPFNKYGRVFTFSWLGFMLSFWSWYAFSPLLTKTIKADLRLTQNEIANGNILALTATLVVRFVAGPLCDRFGPRYVFAGLIFAGALPTALAGTATSAAGLTTIRFFVGILGGTFVPCQVWSTGFFDKNVVGTSNGLIGGWGNAGGGITYFAMPAIFESLVRHGLKDHVAWRVAFIVPFILLTATAIGMLLLCDDTPTGKWSDRMVHLDQSVQTNEGALDENAPEKKPVDADKLSEKNAADSDMEAVAEVQQGQVINHDYRHEAVVKPTAKELLKVVTSPQTVALAACYFNSFGGELAINSILGAYYMKNFPKTLNQTTSGQWAAMFGLVNVFFRPAGGIIGDLLYKYTNGSLWAKKLWLHFVGVMTGVFCLALGLTDPDDLATMVGLVLGVAFFMDAGNGASFSLVPHVHPFANGIVSGTVGATGNLGGVVFAIIFRYTNLNYHQGIWIIGVFSITMNLISCIVQPIPRTQIGGR